MKTPSLRVLPPAVTNSQARPGFDRRDRQGTSWIFHAARPVVPGRLKAWLASFILAAVSAHAVVYDFLPVTILAGNNTGQFTSINANGFITATT